MRCSTKNHDDASAPVCVDGEFLASRVVNTFRADVAKDCLAALMSRPDTDELTVDDLVNVAVIAADTLIVALKGGPR